MRELTIEFNQDILPQEEIRVFISKKRRSFTGYLNYVRYVDKDTKQHVVYIPSLELSAYGETQNKADSMIAEVIDEYMQYFRNSAPEKIQNELARLGWIKSRFFKKLYSKASVDMNGNLVGLNAEEDSVEHLSLAAV